ncbi:hypothetical protein PsYK624_074990 [Phanerochaete sordida]|uniref:Uncharacterized protein n=1 Tax=Phanerochaete sordida TaxID=48140 RepID=A0A9P3GCH8_9APHY|nr:hypothetical protein PsYK624_074990 [Phanerochaete sordida]
MFQTTVLLLDTRPPTFSSREGWLHFMNGTLRFLSVQRPHESLDFLGLLLPPAPGRSRDTLIPLRRGDRCTIPRSPLA